MTLPSQQVVDNSDRYFFGTSEGVVDLEAAVLEKPKDVQLWLMLAYKQLVDDRFVCLFTLVGLCRHYRLRLVSPSIRPPSFKNSGTNRGTE